MVQIADSDAEDEQLVLGEGEQDISMHIGTLKKRDYKGPIALEITMEEYADGAEKYYAQSLNTFQNILNGEVTDLHKIHFDQFGIMTVNYQQYSLEYCFDSIAENGFKRVDFWGGAPHYCTFDTPIGKGRNECRIFGKCWMRGNLKCQSLQRSKSVCIRLMWHHLIHM